MFSSKTNWHSWIFYSHYHSTFNMTLIQLWSNGVTIMIRTWSSGLHILEFGCWRLEEFWISCPIVIINGCDHRRCTVQRWHEYRLRKSHRVGHRIGIEKSHWITKLTGYYVVIGYWSSNQNWDNYHLQQFVQSIKIHVKKTTLIWIKLFFIWWDKSKKGKLQTRRWMLSLNFLFLGSFSPFGDGVFIERTLSKSRQCSKKSPGANGDRCQCAFNNDKK